MRHRHHFDVLDRLQRPPHALQHEAVVIRDQHALRDASVYRWPYASTLALLVRTADTVWQPGRWRHTPTAHQLSRRMNGLARTGLPQPAGVARRARRRGAGAGISSFRPASI